MKFKKILIANRGEIAVRIIRTCKEMGIDTVSVHSVEDNDSLHVKFADESVCIGPAKASLSYLNMHAILSAAEITNVDAIHPGFGFLSENSEFANLVQACNLTWIGPKVSCIKEMGNKLLSKEIAVKAGIPTLKPIKVEGQTSEQLLEDIQKLGLPVLIKASAGGGGRGMQKVFELKDLFPSIARLKEEAKAAFGDGTLFIEKYIDSPRHIEVQILGDKAGNVIHLGERDCTIQRRFQKIIEESPSPILSDKKREEICKAAVKISSYVGYDSVGTVEFLYDQNTQEFFFMEMNTRIQVEHPVTEMITGIDLIREQIKSAQNQPLSYKQSDIKFTGHSIECRINAEDWKNARPSPGVISHWHRPGGIGVRVDDFIYSGYRVSPYYDSMLAKVIVHAANRPDAISRMTRALGELVLNGISSNVELHKMIMLDKNFRGNNYATDFLQKKLG